jgi:hypothetical protein
MTLSFVMAGFVPAIHIVLFAACKDVDARGSPGMTAKQVAAPHTFSNGGSIVLRFSSHAGTGRFLERMKSGLNSFD